MNVMGFVPVHYSVGGYLTHLSGSTIQCRWPGTAEEWLEALVLHGAYRQWHAELGGPVPAAASDPPPAAAPQLRYRSARVFRVFPTVPNPAATDAQRRDGILVAIWELNG